MLQIDMQTAFRCSLMALGLLVLSLGRADHALADGRTKQAEAERKPGDSPTTIGELLQAGAKLPGKAHPQESPMKDLIDAEQKGTSSSSVRKAALATVPVDKLSPENQKRVNSLLKSVSFYRRLPKVTFAIEPEVYSYFVAHPDVAVSIWRAMKISKLQMWQTGRYDYEADTGDGSVGKLEVLYSGAEQHLVFCDGEYKSPMFKNKIAAQSLVLLQTSFFKEADGTIYCTHRADLFVTFPSQTIDVVSKIFSPLAVAMTDRTFSEISLFLKMFSMAMTRRPDWVEQIAAKMEGVPELRKEQVLQLTAQVYTAAQKRSMERDEESATIPTGAREPAGTATFPGIPNVPTARVAAER